MKKLLREQMKKVVGGYAHEGDCKCEDGTAALGDACSINTPTCSRRCACGKTCQDRGNETGSVCVD